MSIFTTHSSTPKFPPTSANINTLPAKKMPQNHSMKPRRHARARATAVWETYPLKVMTDNRNPPTQDTPTQDTPTVKYSKPPTRSSHKNARRSRCLNKTGKKHDNRVW